MLFSVRVFNAHCPLLFSRKESSAADETLSEREWKMADFDDAPISKPEDDRFGYDPFAQAIAKCVLRLKGHVGSVVAIYGPWGSGKSSVINLVRHHLNEEDGAPVVISFQAWWYRTEDALAVGFFQELYAALDRELPKGTREKTRDALAKLGGHIAGAGQLLGAAAGLVAGSVAEGTVNAISSTLANYIRTDENTETLQRNVADALAEQEKRFLVVIDDLDRLSPDEVLVVLRLIKSVGRLPNVAYLLSYDRAVVEKVVAERYPSEGAHYLEKIVQAGFELPPPDAFRLRQMFAQQMDKVFLQADVGELLGMNDGDLPNLLHEAVYAELRSPRDVVRLTNSAEITWGAIRGEVNVADFLALEALRLFRPTMYSAIRSNKHRLTGAAPSTAYGRKADDAGLLELLFLDAEPNTERPRLKNVLQRLFPRLEAVWGNTIRNSYGEWEKNRRVCSESHFDTYFAYTLSNETISQAEIDMILAVAGDCGKVKSILREAVKVPMLGGRTRASYVLEAIAPHAGSIQTEKVEAFLRALFEVADELMLCADKAGLYGMVDNSSRLRWMLDSLVVERMALPDRSALLLRLAEHASIAWLVYLVGTADRLHTLKEKGEVSDDRLLTTIDDQTKLKDLFMDRIAESARDGGLIRAPDLRLCLYRWAHCSGDGGEAVRAWTEGLMADDQGVPKLAEAFLGTAWTQGFGVSGLGDVVARRSDTAQIDGATEIIDLDRFRERLESWLQDRGQAEGAETVRRLLAAWDRKVGHDGSAVDAGPV